jgi:hypothetical protein
MTTSEYDLERVKEAIARIAELHDCVTPAQALQLAKDLRAAADVLSADALDRAARMQ